VIALLSEPAFLKHFTHFLLSFFLPWSAISLFDYYLISHQSVDIPALFDPKGRYGYWNFVDPASLRRRALQRKELRLWV